MQFERMTDDCWSEANIITYGKLSDAVLMIIDASCGDLVVPGGSQPQINRHPGA